MTPLQILVVDDEPDLRWVLRGLFEDEGFAVREADDGDTALLALRDAVPDVILSDVRMQRVAGLELLQQVQRQHPDLPVVLLSAVEDVATAVSAVRAGAFDYQAKPFEPERLLLTVRRAAEQHRLRREVSDLRRSSARGEVDFGPSPASRQLAATIELVAAQPSLAVLLCGESGTGKEVAARAIHARSPAAAGPFVAVDCGALPEPLLESHLFGHVRGAFTGADRARVGLFPMADGGTLFLDELGNLPLSLQAKLLRALQERAVVPVGGREPVPFRARLLAATNNDLGADVQAGRFRLDLYHRVAEFVLPLPPLRSRPDDVLHFATRFLAEANREMGRHVTGFDASASQALVQRSWPGNLRELRNTIRRAVLVAPETQLSAADLAPALPTPPPEPGVSVLGAGDGTLAERIRSATATLERQILSDTLASHAGNKAAAARALGIDYTTLHRKLKRYALDG
jgi:DNA-binding NtrC family response regulator